MRRPAAGAFRISHRDVADCDAMPLRLLPRVGFRGLRLAELPHAPGERMIRLGGLSLNGSTYGKDDRNPSKSLAHVPGMAEGEAARLRPNRQTMRLLPDRHALYVAG